MSIVRNSDHVFATQKVIKELIQIDLGVSTGLVGRYAPEMNPGVRRGLTKDVTLNEGAAFFAAFELFNKYELKAHVAARIAVQMRELLAGSPNAERVTIVALGNGAFQVLEAADVSTGIISGQAVKFALDINVETYRRRLVNAMAEREAARRSKLVDNHES